MMRTLPNSLEGLVLRLVRKKLVTSRYVIVRDCHYVDGGAPTAAAAILVALIDGNATM